MLDLLAVVTDWVFTKSPSIDAVIIPTSQMRFSKALEVRGGNLVTGERSHLVPIRHFVNKNLACCFLIVKVGLPHSLIHLTFLELHS